MKNAYRAYKYLYYTILDAICCHLLRKELEQESFEDSIPLPDHFDQFSDAEKITWINDLCERIIDKYFFESSPDIMSKLRDCVTDKNHPDNYWVSNFIDGRVKCHHCEKTYAYVGSLKVHEEKLHGVTVSKKQRKDKGKSKDKLYVTTLQTFTFT